MCVRPGKPLEAKGCGWPNREMAFEFDHLQKRLAAGDIAIPGQTLDGDRRRAMGLDGARDRSVDPFQAPGFGQRGGGLQGCGPLDHDGAVPGYHDGEAHPGNPGIDRKDGRIEHMFPRIEGGSDRGNHPRSAITSSGMSKLA